MSQPNHITRIVKVKGNEEFAVVKELKETDQKAYAEVATPDPMNSDDVLAKNLISEVPVKKTRGKAKVTETIVDNIENH